MITPKEAISLLRGGETEENKKEYQEAVALAEECIRSWMVTSMAAKILALKEGKK